MDTKRQMAGSPRPGSMLRAPGRFARAVVATLLIVTALAAGHQHHLVASAPADAAISRHEAVGGNTGRLSSDCAVCRALQSTEPAFFREWQPVLTQAVPIGAGEGDAPVLLPRTSRAPRGPPALPA